MLRVSCGRGAAGASVCRRRTRPPGGTGANAGAAAGAVVAATRFNEGSPAGLSDLGCVTPLGFLITSDSPIVAANANSGNPHYEPTSAKASLIREGDFVLLDIWAKKNVPNAVYYDITWTGFVGSSPSRRMQEVFQVVRGGRVAGSKFVEQSIAAGKTIAGWQVDQLVRDQITKAGFGDYFVHRTGHSIGTEVHANGANMDDLEVHDERRILPNSLFSIEPGVYLAEFGVRSEINMLVRSGRAEVTGRMQRELVII